MAAGDEYKNPPLWKSEPANGQVGVYEAASDTMVPTGVGSLPGATIPVTHIATVTAPNATDLASAETLANANKVAINLLITELTTAGIISAS